VADVLDDRDAEARARAVVRRTRRARRRKAPLGAIAVATASLVTVSALAYRTWRAPEPQGTSEPSVLGRSSTTLTAGRRSFGPRSWIEVSADTDATLLETRDAFEIVLTQGAVELDVRAEDRRVDLDAGLVHLSAIGAHLTVVRGDDVRGDEARGGDVRGDTVRGAVRGDTVRGDTVRGDTVRGDTVRGDTVRVVVHAGRVLARGDHVPERARMLAAGESIVVREPATPSPSIPSAPPSETPAEEEVVRPRMPARDVAPRRWRELADAGEYREAWRALDEAGVSHEVRVSDPEELLSLADVARRSGHAARAEEPLTELLRRFPDDPAAALGAFTLGRLRADQLGRPADAAEAFERALRSSLPSTLVPDALARLALARRDAGQPERARADATRYLERFPNGPRAAEIRAIVDAR
jgi:transmembrane sensor